MPLWLVLLLAALAMVALAALLVPWRLQLSAEAHAGPDGSWAAAAGLAVGPFALSGAGARGVPATMHLYWFGKRRHSQKLEQEPDEPPEGELEESSTEEHAPRVRSGWRKFYDRHFDAVDAVAWLLSERRRVALDLDVEVSYSCRDIALTGRIFAASCLLVPLLPAGVRFRPAPSWDTVDRGSLRASGNVRLFAGLVLWDLIWYMLRKRFARREPRLQSASE